MNHLSFKYIPLSSLVLFLCFLSVACSPTPSGQLFAFPEEDSAFKEVDASSMKRIPTPAVKSSNNLQRRIDGGVEEVELDALSLSSSRFPAHSGKITALVLHPLQPIAYTAGLDGKVVEHRLIRKTSAKSWARQDLSGLESKILMQSNNQVFSLAISPDTTLLAAAEQGQVVLYDLGTGKIVHRMTRIGGRVKALAWDPRSELLALGLANGGVYIWNVRRGNYAAENSFKALEYYGGAISSIISIIFHPSARAFFAIETEGIGKFWRLLRTEEELGLRDTAAIVDKPNKGRREETFARLKLQFEDSWLSPDGSTIAIAAGDGHIFRWKIRGLQYLKPINTDQGAAFSVAGFNSSILSNFKNESSITPVYVTTGRVHGVRFWCVPESSNIHALEELPAELSAPKLLFELESLGHDVSKIRIDPRWGILWITEKTGSLLTLDLNKLDQVEQFGLNIAACKI